MPNDLTPPQAPTVIGRFAPSPTGPLHFGSLLAAVGSYCLARQTGGRWLVRMEDLDPPRVVAGAADAILHTLQRLGLEWDGEVTYQSRRTAAYEAILAELQQQNAVFPCCCSRREIFASAPHPGEEGPLYPGTCRDGLPPGRPLRAWRLRVPAERIGFTDGIYGWREQPLAQAVGDFVLKRSDGLFAYQLAVVVDDAASGINQVVRGADLLSSTPRQIYLQRCLQLPQPQYFHLPLALGADGEKLSKRHGDVLLKGRFAGNALWRALAFLGQHPPAELDQAPPREILQWGVRHFQAAQVPPSSRRSDP